MTETIIQRDQKYIWHPYTQAKIAPIPIAINHAKGAYLFSECGKKLFDGISSWWVNSHGHCHPHINEAIRRQSEILEQVIFANFTHEPAVSLAQKIINLAPNSLQRVFYSDNGSTAVEVALKMAYQYWQHQAENRPYFIALENSYHGDTFGAMSASARSVFTKPFWPLLFNVLKTPSPCVSEASNFALEKLKHLFESHKNQIAGLIIEPMLQGAGGMRIFNQGFLTGVKKLCEENNTLLIADEVATGFYRTGKLFACEHEMISPDIMCLAKGLTGGYLPLSATLASEAIYQAFLSDDKSDALFHGHSFAANPLGCAAALASLELFNQPQTKQNIKNICDVVSQRIADFSPLIGVKNARSIGTIGIIELDSEHSGYLSRSSEKIYEYCLERGLFIRPLGNIIYLMPPFCTTVSELNWAFDLILEALLASRA